MAAPSPTPSPETPGAIRWTGLLLVVATVLAYANSLGGPLIFDDKPAILDNPTIRHLWPLSTVLSPPAIGSGVTGRPMVNLTLALDYAVSGPEVWSYHATNLLIHVLAGLALFGIVRRTLRQPVIPERLRTAALPVAGMTAALWLLHPLVTESVTSVIQRTESQVGLCYLLTLYAFIRSVESPRPRAWQTAAVLVAALGMATKEVMVTAPVLVLAYDCAFVAGSLRESWRRRGGFHLALAATWLVLAALLLSGGGTRGEAAGFGLGVTPWTYALTQCRAVILYLRLAVWPHPLVLDYGTDVVRHAGDVWPQGLLLLGLLALTAWTWIRRPVAGFAGVAFFLILGPSSSVVPLVSQTIAEHRMYLPLAALVALGVAAAYLRWGRGALVVAAIVAVGFGGLTWQRNRAYQSELGLWTETVAQAPANARARINLAECLLLLGRPAEALPHAQEAVHLKPNYPEAHTNVAIALAELGRPEEALPSCLEALRLKPDSARAHSNLGTVLIKLGRLPEAITHLEESLRLAPDAPDAAKVRNNLGIALLRAGRPADAIPEFLAVLRVDPSLAETRFTLAVAYGLCERLPEAAQQLEAVLQLKPDHAAARSALESVRAEIAAARPAGP